MNAPIKPESFSPLTVNDERIRKQLHLAALRFVCSRAWWLESETRTLGIAFILN